MKQAEHDYKCENYLVSCDPNQSGYRQWKNFLRQWYIHGPFPMSEEIRAAAQARQWNEVLDAEATANEATLTPDAKPVTDPRKMVEQEAWMRWETYLRGTNWWCPEKVIACAMTHEWYIPRTENYPQWAMPPDRIHLPIEHYRKEDVLSPFWVGPYGTGCPYCPRCEIKLEGKPDTCPNCTQRLGGYDSYSAPGWPRKALRENCPALPDEYSFYFLAARVHIPADMGQMNLMVGSDCRYKVWINHEEAGRYVGPSRFCRWDMDRHVVDLNEGWNLLLVKLAHEKLKADEGTFVARFGFFDNRLVTVHDFQNENFATETQLRITASEPIAIGIDDDFPMLRRFPDGSLVCNTFKSSNGVDWTPCQKLISHETNAVWQDAKPADPQKWERKQNPSTLILHEKCTELKPGVYLGKLCRSTDGWSSRETLDTTIYLPDGTNLVDEANRETGPGIIMGTNIVGLPNGELLVPMYGSLKQDVVWFDYRVFGGYLKYPQQWPRQFKYRSWVLRSQDGGKTWSYLSTIAALPELGDEGFCEPNLELADDGTLLAVLRNGGGLKSPLSISRSQDNGVSWSYPVRTTLTGNYPSLLQMSNGILACVYGRPNNRVSFDLTGTGLGWSHTVVLFNGRSNDHVEAAEIAPGELFCVFEDNEYDASGQRLPNGMRQWYGVRVKTQQL